MVNKQSGKEGTPKLIHQAPPCDGVFARILNNYFNK